MSTQVGDPARHPYAIPSGSPSVLGWLLRLDQERRDWVAQRAERELWADAHSMADLSELTVQWLERKIDYHPNGYSWGPDPETDEITPALITLNRAGFVTQNSQPGAEGSSLYWAQQTSVTGFGDDSTLTRIRAACENTELVVIAHRTPKHPWPFRARLDKGGPLAATTVGGNQLTERWIRLQFGGVGDEAYQEILDAWQITVIDPVWGRRDLLWDTLTSAIAPSCCPCRGEHSVE